MVPNFVASYRLNRWKPVGQAGSLGGHCLPCVQAPQPQAGVHYREALLASEGLQALAPLPGHPLARLGPADARGSDWTDQRWSHPRPGGPGPGEADVASWWRQRGCWTLGREQVQGLPSPPLTGGLCGSLLLPL